MGLTSTARRAGERVRPHLREGDLGKGGIALTLALLTVLAAVVAGLQSHASTTAQQSRREADRIGLAATDQDASAVLRVGNAYGAYRRWYEQLERSSWARDSLTRDPEGTDAKLLEALEQINRGIADWVVGQSTLLQPPYYDAVRR
ncbi:MAG: hypothetical protein FJ038_04675, partial [Chloroflexi bacterium]|nr:hypothetical protein [Chloroflexota bacterium]